MAPRKKDIKPLFAVKHDFVDSLDHMIMEGINFLQAVETHLDLEKPTGPTVGVVRERLAKFKSALLTDE
jgi:hypothetical protein